MKCVTVFYNRIVCEVIVHGGQQQTQALCAVVFGHCVALYSCFVLYVEWKILSKVGNQ